jgi:hypothetical protein
VTLYSIQALPAGCGTTLYSVFFPKANTKARRHEDFFPPSCLRVFVFPVFFGKFFYICQVI